jgi:hypothetical protein
LFIEKKKLFLLILAHVSGCAAHPSVDMSGGSAGSTVLRYTLPQTGTYSIDVYMRNTAEMQGCDETTSDGVRLFIFSSSLLQTVQTVDSRPNCWIDPGQLVQDTRIFGLSGDFIDFILTGKNQSACDFTLLEVVANYRWAEDTTAMMSAPRPPQSAYTDINLVADSLVDFQYNHTVGYRGWRSHLYDRAIGSLFRQAHAIVLSLALLQQVCFAASVSTSVMSNCCILL